MSKVNESTDMSFFFCCVDDPNYPLPNVIKTGVILHCATNMRYR